LGWKKDCKDVQNPASLYFIFGSNVKYEVTPESYMNSSPGQCAIMIQGGQTQFYIMGDTFLRNYYTVFDAAGLRVGFTPSKTSTAKISTFFPTWGIVLIVLACVLVLGIGGYLIYKRQQRKKKSVGGGGAGYQALGGEQRPPTLNA
jgi:hypothetical protein